jgi:hypothetical protein
MSAKKRWTVFSLAVLALSLGVLSTADGYAGQRNGKGNGNGNAGVLVPLTDAEKATLTFMREEEKLARDVYIKMFETWEDRIFSNISVSEQRHMDALLRQLNKYGVPDPAAGLAIGIFKNAELQKAYDELVLQGAQSIQEALRVGRLIEEMDIEDLLAAIDETEKTDLERVYGNLLNGSYNHLQAFTLHPDSIIQ